MFFVHLKKKDQLKKRQGMSLVEVLIALIILVIALFSLTEMVPMTTKLMATSIHHEEASLIAQQQLEFLEGCSFDSGALSDDQSFSYSLDGVSRDFFDCSYTVSDVLGGHGKDVIISISWENGKHNVDISRTLSRFSQRTVDDDAH